MLPETDFSMLVGPQEGVICPRREPLSTCREGMAVSPKLRHREVTKSQGPAHWLRLFLAVGDWGGWVS